jgi:hypothetical protein
VPKLVTIPCRSCEKVPNNGFLHVLNRPPVISEASAAWTNPLFQSTWQGVLNSSQAAVTQITNILLRRHNSSSRHMGSDLKVMMAETPGQSKFY